MRCCFAVCAALLCVCAAEAPDPEADSIAADPLDVLLVAVGLRGHAVPLARLAAALRARGHRATLATHDSAEARRWAREAGAAFVSLGALEPAPVSKTTTVAERAAGLMAAALRGFSDPAKDKDVNGWDTIEEEDEGPLDARRLLLAARRARHEAAAQHLNQPHNGSVVDTTLIPPSVTFAKASRRATALGALSCLMNELYLPLARPVYDALYAHLARGAARPDVIVMDAATLGARDAADVFDIPLVINAPTLLYGRLGGAPGAALGLNASRSQRAAAMLAPKLLALASTPALLNSNHARRGVGLRTRTGPDELVPPALLRRPAAGTDFPCSARARTLELLPPRNGTCVSDGICAARPRELVLANTAPGFDPAAADPPARVLATGPLLPVAMAAFNATNPPPAPALVRRWLEQAAKEGPGVVVVALGRTPRVEGWQAHALVRGLQPAPSSNASAWRVLWALDEDRRDSLPRALPDEFRVRSRLPLLSTIAQPEVKVVISHCGAGAAMEALAFGKPLVCVPFFGDQRDVAQRVVDAGAGVLIEPRRLSEERVRKAVRDVDSESFRTAAARAGAQLRAPGGVQAAALAVEAWAAHATVCGPDVDLPWHREVGLDRLCVAAAGGILLAAGAGKLLSASFQF